MTVWVSVWQCVAVCGSVWQCVTVCCSLWQYVVVRGSEVRAGEFVAVWGIVGQHVALE